VNNIKLRIISKIGLLFVVIGFFLPISCNLNGFQIAKTVETFGGPNILSISLYSIFIFSCIGLILLFALLMKYKFGIGYDWFDLIIIIIAFSVFMYIQIQSSDDPLLAIFNRLQSGAYIIFIGLTGSLFFLISASLKSQKTTNEIVNNEIELDEDKLKKIRVMYRIEFILAGVGALFSSAFLFGYYKDYLYKYILDDVSSNNIVNFILMFTSAANWFIFLYLFQGLLDIIFSIIDKKAVNYWKNEAPIDVLTGGLFNKQETTKEVNKSEIDKDKTELDEDEKERRKKSDKKEIIFSVLGAIFMMIILFPISAFLFGLLYNLIPFKSEFVFNIHVILFSIISYGGVALIIFYLTVLIYHKIFGDLKESKPK
jgi:hypothetical protein